MPDPAPEASTPAAQRGHERTERLLNLLFLLMASQRPVARATLRTAIAEYAASPSDTAFERMFERDKEELRSMGIPVAAVGGDLGPGGIDGYRVSGQEYALPEVSFTAEELTVLGLAAQVWEQASLAPAARSALRKLEASGGRARTEDVGVMARYTTPEPSFPAFLAASQARRPVRFAYRKPDEDEATERRLEPWGVVSRRRHWYVVGHDRDRDAPRVFRLSRVTGPVRADGHDGEYEVPVAPADLRALVETGSTPADLVATLRVRAGEAASLRRTAAATAPAGEGWDRLEVGYGDDESFADRLVGHGAAVVVEDPATLRDAVVRRLREALAATEGAA